MTMSFDQSKSTITVNGVTYDVEEHSTNYGQRYTLSLDGEEVFEGLEGLCENEQYIHEGANPRDASNVGTMSIFYRGYNLGGPDDEDISQVDFQIECGECEDGVVTGLSEIPGGEDTCAKCDGSNYVTLNPIDYFKRERKARVVLPLIVYEHSGITMQVGHVGQVMGDAAGWDTSFVGFIFDTPEQLAETMGADVTDEKIEEALRAEIKQYASYLEGDVCWYKVEDEETNFHESCGGFVGCHEECENEMYSDLEHALIKRINEETERAYWLDRGVVTV
jgi:hypothetical protein